ncbi:hypothetical protein [Rickettsiella grylli]|uniref:Leucine Rich Repeat domain protein n=1 Tax=Rickettsiella grylli TaxID=59196 RepID=A8PK98_9COXI|nr:hypothetical protein [Rickettsiella grylli]EDP46122.1 hypothetical protein RICGR_0280 [Rickettsiella grylli]
MNTQEFLQSEEDFDPFLLADELNDQNNERSEEDERESNESNTDLSQTLSQTISSLAVFTRYWHSPYFINRLAWWELKHSFEVDDSLENRNSIRLFWLKGEGIPLNDVSLIQQANLIRRFIDSTRFVFSNVGAVILAALLFHDWRSYRLFPEERCGVTGFDILKGTATNQITWTNHLGSDVIHEASYWSWLGIVLIPPLAGLSSVFLYHDPLQPLDTQEVTTHITTVLRHLDKESLTFLDACAVLFPLSTLNKRFAQVKFMVLWDGRKTNDHHLLISFHLKKALVNTLIELTESRYFLIRYRAMQLLTQIAASFHPENLERFIADPIHKADLTELREIILATLRNDPCQVHIRHAVERESTEMSSQPFEIEDTALIESDRRKKTRWMARYFRWTLGDDTRPLTQLFWIPSLFISVCTFYSLCRYLDFIVKKWIDISDYFQDKSACENNGNYFKFLTLSERYECVACDWSFVNYQQSFSAQACLENLLQQKMPPSTFIRYLSELPAVRGMTRVDLSQQDWPSWPVSTWEQFLLTVQSRVITPLQVFNVSGALKNDAREEPSQQHMHALAQFLTRINVTRLDMSNQFLNDALFHLLIGSLAASTLQELHLTHTNMTDVSATFLAHSIYSDFQNLNNLQLADNNITDEGIARMSEAFPKRSLRILNLANNPLTDVGLQTLAQGIQQSSLHHLDLSGQPFSARALKVFSETLNGNSSLKGLKISNAGLKGDHLIALQTCLEHLESFDVSSNLLTGKAVKWLLKTNQQNLKILNVAHNDLKQEAGALIAEELSTSVLQDLDLSDNSLTQGFKQLASALPDSQLVRLSCERCELDDEAVVELTEIFANHTLSLRALNLNDNKITDIPLMNWFAVLPQTNVRELHLNHNKISNSNDSAPLLAQGFSQTNLTFLDLSHNVLDENFFNALAPRLHQSQLQQLRLNDDKREASSLKQFAEALVELPCHRSDLDATQLSRQMKRVFYPMRPATKLKQLDIINAKPDRSTRRSFCRVAASLPPIRFLDHRIQQLDWHTCRLSTNTPPVVQFNQTHVSPPSKQSPSVKSALLLGSSPFLISVLCAGGILCVIALFYGVYRASQSTCRFFRAAPPRLPFIEAESAEINNDNGRPSPRS